MSFATFIVSVLILSTGFVLIVSCLFYEVVRLKTWINSVKMKCSAEWYRRDHCSGDCLWVCMVIPYIGILSYVWGM